MVLSHTFVIINYSFINQLEDLILQVLLYYESVQYLCENEYMSMYHKVTRSQNRKLGVSSQ